MSCKCNPVVGSSKINILFLRLLFKKEASFNLCNSPPLKVLNVWPDFTYPKPTFFKGSKYLVIFF